MRAHASQAEAVPVEPFPAVMNDNALWTARQAAAYLNMSVHWVYRQSEAGLLPHRKLGSALRFDPVRLRAWLESQPGK